MATWNAIITGAPEDARQIAGSGATLTDSPISLTAGTHWAGLRFQSCPIPNSATINSATLTLELISGFASPDGLVIYGNDVDDAAGFTTGTNDISGRTLTTASVTWSGTALGAGDRSPGDLKTIIEEITTRGGWAAGNDLALIFDAVAATSLRFTSYDGSTTACARLVVDYTVATQTLTGATIASTAVLYAIAKLSLHILAATITSGGTLYAPTVTPGEVELAGATIAAGTTLYAPAIVGDQTLDGATITSGAALYAPTVTQPQELDGATIGAGSTVYAPAKVNHVLAGATIASGSTVYAPEEVEETIGVGALRAVNVTTYAQGDVSSASFAHETPAGENRLLLVVATYYDPAGVASLIFGESGTGNGEFDSPNDVAVASDGTIYVTDYSNNRVQYFDADGTYQGQWGTNGTGNGEFAFPVGVAVASDGTVYVADTDNHRIQYFDADGTYQGQWGTNGTGNGEFESPTNIAIAADGTIYVNDWGNDRIQYFNASRVYQGEWGSSGTGNGQFTNATDIAVAPDGTVYVVDSDRKDVQHFSAAGVYQGQWGTNGIANGEFVDPTGVAVASDGMVFVVDSGNARIQAFTADGVYVKKWGGYGTGDGQFIAPLAAGMGPDDMLYVADADNDRIQAFPADLELTTAQYNGVEMETGPYADSGGYFQAFYILANPPVGTYDVALVSPTEPNAFIVHAISFTGAESADTDYTAPDAGAAEEETSTTALQISHNNDYRTNTLSIWALLYETAGTTLTPAADNANWFSANVDTLTSSLGYRITTSAGTAIKTFGATASPAVTQKITGVIHIESARGMLLLPFIASGSTLYAGRVNPEGFVLDGATIDSTAAVNAPAMVTKALAGAHIASTAAVYTPAKVSHKLGGASISGTTLYAPTVAVGTHTLTGAAIASGATLYGPALAPGGVTLEGEHIAETPTVYAPAAIVPGAVTLRARPVDTTTQVYTPKSVTNFRHVDPPQIESTATLYAPAGVVLRTYLQLPIIGCETPMAINSPAFIDIATLYAGVLSMRLYGAAISSGATVYTPVDITTTARIQSGDVFPPEEVET